MVLMRTRRKKETNGGKKGKKMLQTNNWASKCYKRPSSFVAIAKPRHLAVAQDGKKERTASSGDVVYWPSMRYPLLV
jgi:hypothetical protein